MRRIILPRRITPLIPTSTIYRRHVTQLREKFYMTFLLNSVSQEIRLIKMSLSETSKRVRVGRFLSDAFPIHCGLKTEMHYHLYFSTLLWNIPLAESKKTE